MTMMNEKTSELLEALNLLADGLEFVISQQKEKGISTITLNEIDAKELVDLLREIIKQFKSNDDLLREIIKQFKLTALIDIN